MAKKKGSGKVSSIKRTNQRQTKLRKQGKLKKKHNRRKETKVFKKQIRVQEEEKIDSDKENKFEEEQLEDLKNNYTADNFKFLANAQLDSDVKSRRRKRKLNDESEINPIEYQYEQSAIQALDSKKVKYLLPIKTNEGIVTRSMEIEDDEHNTNEEEVQIEQQNFQIKEKEKKVYSGIDLLSSRMNSLKKKKFRIGVLCSGLLENPEIKINNFKPLLEMINENDPAICITVKKLALVSILEVFKDILPEYQIKFHDNPKVKLKKHVKVLRDYESELLRYYKCYLQKIENILLVFKKKSAKSLQLPELNLSMVALKCLCDLLLTHPYFNYSKNIINLIVPYLNIGIENVRKLAFSTIKEIFRTDKRGEISLYVVRCINKLVKRKNNSVYPETIKVFLSLKLKDIDLDKEKEDELKKKKMKSKKHKILKMSKREKKRKKRLQDLEKELLETKATESKERKQQYLTEITKLVFMIYFKILKITPSSKLLNSALEGLAKFAHCINVEFYHDLVNILDHLIQYQNLGFKEKLCCVYTVFTILFYQGATIYLDPTRFYSHLYSNIIFLDAGKNHSDLPFVLKVIEIVLLKRRKNISLQRLLAFTKRLSSLTLQLLPNGSLAFLSIIKEILQVNSSTDVLLDIDSSIGQGVYYPEIDEPEYCNAGVSSLWELLPLQRHFHPAVREYAKNVAGSNNSDENKISQFKNLFKMSSGEIFKEYDASEVKFNPSVPLPKKFRKKSGQKSLLNDDLNELAEKVLYAEEKPQIILDF